MTGPTDVIVQPMSPERLPDYLAFFEKRGFTDNPGWAGCYCYFPYHDPADSDWTSRTGAENREAITACCRDEKMAGYLAYADGEVVGWCNAGPRHLYPSLARLPGDARTTGAIPCFLIAPEWRRQKVATRLLEAACEGLKAQGILKVIAKPTRGAVGNPISVDLPNGVTVFYSHWIDMLPDGTVIEIKGVIPDVVVAHEGPGDPTFTAGLKELRKRTKKSPGKK